MATGNMYRKSR